ncbi:hypothetical protein CH330_02255 [candidate division WOR-3 bacterium JGI_Cruoil_03_51_56]|uniref:M23ase beta-sheet core domain-containing protein n=1 Tax=candidate division WOR-3 bacterium JGI_Cruoil_03_51_56 TaxID=1973747 RepID=A0A235BYL6_UNCW3|nr:MAG: hypothetical protein CH330_02255 [candidate division WOR-3 bacterium JGI_Cruoil_03_51_56]
MSELPRKNKNDSGTLPPFESWQPRKPAKPKFPRTFSIAAIIVVVAGIITVVLLARRGSDKPASVVKNSTGTTWHSRCFVVRQDEIMPSLLFRAGFTGSTADTIIAALGHGGFSFRRMRPGDSLRLTYCNDRLAHIYYQQNYERVYRLDLDSNECRISMLLRHICSISAIIKGGIKTCLYKAMLDLGEKPTLTANFADIFAWEIDFFSETHKNDSFTILVNKKSADSSFVGYGPILAARYQGKVGNFWGFRFTDPDGHTDYYNAEGQSLRKTFLKSPLHFSRITSYFGMRYHPIRHIRCKHHGIDYAAPIGTPVSCVADGRVTIAGWKGGYGKLVEVSHANGFKTRYGHLSRFGKGIKTRVHVNQGQVIGYVGSTGLSTGPHLHYEVRKFGTPINPLRMNAPRAEPVKKAYLEQFRAVRDSLQQVMAQIAGVMPPPQPDQEPH